MIDVRTTELLTTADAAAALGITPARVIQLANAGRLRPVLNSQGGRLFPAEEITRFARERRKTRRQ